MGVKFCAISGLILAATKCSGLWPYSPARTCFCEFVFDVLCTSDTRQELKFYRLILSKTGHQYTVSLLAMISSIAMIPLKY